MKLENKTNCFSSIRLEASTLCQLKCPSCPNASGEVGKNIKAGFLKFEDFKKFVDSNPCIREIELSNWGEIFLNPELGEIIKYGFEKKIVLCADNGVNGNRISDDILEALVRYQFRSITWALDGASSETYAAYRKGGCFENVIENIRKINSIKKRLHSRYPLLKWQFIPFGHNEHEIAQARQMARKLGMSFWIKLSWEGTFTGSDFSPVKNKVYIQSQTGLPVATRGEYEKTYRENYAQKLFCSLLWIKPQINFDGEVLGCCVNYWGSFGNAFNEGLIESLNNEKMSYARQMLKGKVPERPDIPCASCFHYRAMKRHGAWITMGDILLARFLHRFRVWIQDDRYRGLLFITMRILKLFKSNS